jgi:uncharacterized protein
VRLLEHVPVRMCMGCGQRDAQRELVRIRGAADGTLSLVAGRSSSGRTGYLHRRRDCWEHFAGRKGRVRSLGCSVDKAQRAACVQELERILLAAMMR